MSYQIEHDPDLGQRGLLARTRDGNRRRRPFNDHVAFWAFVVAAAANLLTCGIYFLAAGHLGDVAQAAADGHPRSADVVLAAISSDHTASLWFLVSNAAGLIVLRWWRRSIAQRQRASGTVTVTRLPALRAYWIGWVVVVLAGIVLRTQQANSAADVVVAAHHQEIYLGLAILFEAVMVWCALTLRKAAKTAEHGKPA